MFSPRIKLKEETAHQKSTRGQILEWMQDHPKQCKSTNMSSMAKAMERDVSGTQGSLRQIMQRMVNNQMLYRSGNRRYSNFYINYMHKDIPPYVLEKAPEGDKEARKRTEKGLKKNQHLDDVGCVVTEPKKNSDPKTKKNTEKKPVDDAEKIETSKAEPESGEEYPELDEIIEELISVPVSVQKKKENGSTNISITLNLNLNN